jgi:hypothetical protein
MKSSARFSSRSGPARGSRPVRCEIGAPLVQAAGELQVEFRRDANGAMDGVRHRRYHGGGLAGARFHRRPQAIGLQAVGGAATWAMRAAATCSAMTAS